VPIRSVNVTKAFPLGEKRSLEDDLANLNFTSIVGKEGRFFHLVNTARSWKLV